MHLRGVFVHMQYFISLCGLFVVVLQLIGHFKSLYSLYLSLGVLFNATH